MMLRFSALAGVAVVAAIDSGNPSKVVVLTDDNFDEKVKEFEKGFLVEFYAPWCGHCKSLAPEYDAASMMLDEAGSPYKLGKMDATAAKVAPEKYGVRGYPTLKWFANGADAVEYDGPREKAGIVDWIKSATGPAVEEVTEVPDGLKTSVVFGGAEMPEFYETVAKGLKKKAKWFWIKGDKAVYTLTHKGEEPIVGEGLDSDDALKTWFLTNALPKFGELDGETSKDYAEREGFGLIWGLFPMTAETVTESVDKYRPMMLDLQKKVGDKFSVSWTNTAQFGNVMESMFGITSFPKIVVQKKGLDKKYWVYPMENGEADLTADLISEYAGKVWSGEIPANLKSEAAPAEPQEDPVKVIVGTTLMEKVFTEDKDVLLEVYAPWCGHCKKLEPEYIKVGKKVQREGFEDKIVIAKMDGTANDSPSDKIEWSGFPTIVFVKAKSETVMSFDGERTAKGIWKWIKKNSTYADEINAKIAAKKDEGEKAAEPKKEEL